VRQIKPAQLAFGRTIKLPIYLLTYLTALVGLGRRLFIDIIIYIITAAWKNCVSNIVKYYLNVLHCQLHVYLHAAVSVFLCGFV